MGKLSFALIVLVLVGAWPGQALAADHAGLVQGPFKTGPEVTKACLECHARQAKDVMQTVHWTWLEKQDVPGKPPVSIGKMNLLNNFCIALSSNWPRCTSCHAGYGWKDAAFNFADPTLVDCLVCHDTTGTYKKSPAGAGAPDPAVDLLKVAQNVGKPGRQNCGTCHFFGGGGDHIKHGDLDSSLLTPKRSDDIHMAADGKNMVCQDCHQTKSHMIPGEALSVSLGAGPRVRCPDCHKDAPHKSAITNRHAARVACETCHIPTFAKALPTKIWWDWSKAGQDIHAPKDQYGLETYQKIKGEFKWAKDVVPTYLWYNGEASRYLLGDKIDPSRVVRLNSPLGDRNDPKAKIAPFKIMRGKQPYDKQLNTMAVVNAFGGYWKHFDWKQAITDGMKAAGLPFSGEYDFVETEMFWKVNHMVALKDKALKCQDCHGSAGRLDWKALGYERDPSRKK